MRAALAGVALVLNAAGPFLHTALPLAEACLDAGVHYLDISNELQVFRALNALDARARHELGEGITTITLPDGPAQIMPVPTGDLEAAFEATGAPNVIAYTVLRDRVAVDPPAYESFGWARATGADGTTTEAWLQTGDAYAFTAEASIRAVEKALIAPDRGAHSPATAFGADFAFTVGGTTRLDFVAFEQPA